MSELIELSFFKDSKSESLSFSNWSIVFGLILSLNLLSPVYVAKRGLLVKVFSQSASKKSKNFWFSSISKGDSFSFSTLLVVTSTDAQEETKNMQTVKEIKYLFITY